MQFFQNITFTGHHLIIVLLWGAYYLLHSLLASDYVKNRVYSLIPAMRKRYRLVYNILAILLLLPVLLIGAMVQEPWLLPGSGGLRYVSMFFATWGVIIIRLSFKQYDLGEFLGLKASTTDEDTLKTKGILSKIRHPLYAGGILILIGYALFAPTVTNWLISLLSLVYLLVGIRIEEKRLSRRFGKAYLQYKERVPALLPKFR